MTNPNGDLKFEHVYERQPVASITQLIVGRNEGFLTGFVLAGRVDHTRIFFDKDEADEDDGQNVDKTRGESRQVGKIGGKWY